MVVMNPPFGTKDEGIDLVFLEKARGKYIYENKIYV